jgi:hypothetical protein
MPSRPDHLRQALRLIRENMTPGSRRGYVERRLLWEIAELEGSLTRPCRDCGVVFTLTREQAARCARLGQTFPVRCEACALARRDSKVEREQAR